MLQNRLARLSRGTVIRLTVLVAVLGAAVGVVGFHSHSHGDLIVRDAAGNEVTVSQWKLGDVPHELPQRLSAGSLQFALSNTDRVAHDFVVLRTEADAGRLPVENGRVDAGAVGEVVAEVQAFKPGASGTLTFDFEPGTYVLYCNQQGHYERGMYYTFEVEWPGRPALKD